MAKKDILSMPTVAYYSGLNGLEIKGLEYGINDYVLCVSGAWNGKHTPHRVRVYYTERNNNYIRVNGYRIPLDECIRV